MTLTPEMVEIERAAFERVVRAWPNYTERTLARDGRAPGYYGNPVVQGAWEGFKAGRAQSQRAVGVDELRETIDRWLRGRCRRADLIAALRALIERAGGGV